MIDGEEGSSTPTRLPVTKLCLSPAPRRTQELVPYGLTALSDHGGDASPVVVFLSGAEFEVCGFHSLTPHSSLLTAH